ncbi:MAG: hypothetical protein GF329_05385 [Candidatus Lokiarchaeota archaeon]|nr:hypothetical protein [Candidatus Lokiarchaeota archaeon]
MLKQKLNDNWKLNKISTKDNAENIKIDVTLPTTVFEAIINNGIIQDPFYGMNEHEVSWVYESDWEYEARFNVKKELLEFENIIIKFNGLDTISEIYLNDQRLGSTNNMFRYYFFDVKRILKKENNYLQVKFYSPTRFAEKKVKENGNLYIDKMGILGVQYLRKAQYSFGWDWGPRLPDIGIWKDVELIGYDKIKIDSFYIQQEFEYNKNPLIIDVEEIDSIKIKKVDLKINIKLSLGDNYKSSDISKLNDYELEMILTSPEGNQILKSTKINKDDIKFEFSINEPFLWWIYELGQPDIYEIVLNLKKEGKIIENQSGKIGIRDIRLIRNPDQWGETFYFLLNGIPIFSKGANWIPIDNFLTRGKKLGLYSKLLGYVRQSNINMLRIWGGGIYEDDIFYDLCDELGILIWQDFMFACGIYPPDKDFIDNIKEEAIQNIKRLRNHACLALWCGSNEDEWFLGINLLLLFSLKFKFKKKRKYKQAYFEVFENLLPNLISKYDPEHNYWPSSPSNGAMFKNNYSRGLLTSNSPKQGDSHFWDVWHRGKSITAYRKFTPRFMSEFGFQSFPSLKTVFSFCPKGEMDFFSPIMETHQKNETSMVFFRAGNKKVMKYMKRRYKIPESFEKQIVISQIAQAEAMEFGIEHLRRNRKNKKCMGALYWQLNDCWPAISWSSIDYYGRWKALQYIIKRLYTPIFPSVSESKNRITFYITNDLSKEKILRFIWKLIDNNGLIKLEGSKNIRIPPCTSILIDEKNIDGISNNKDLKQHIIFYTLYDQENPVYRGFRLFDSPKYFKLKNPNLIYEIKEINAKKFELTIKSKEIALYVHIISNKYDFITSDNYFSLNKGESRIVKIYLEQQIPYEDLKSNIKIHSLFDLFQ